LGNKNIFLGGENPRICKYMNNLPLNSVKEDTSLSSYFGINNK